MNNYRDPDGVAFVTLPTVPPQGAPSPTGPANSQFGVEKNQVGEESDLTLEDKAQLDLANKVESQKNA